MSEAKSWRVTLHLRDYAVARAIFALGVLSPNYSSTFDALDADGNPLWTDEDEARMTAEIEASE